MRTLLDTDACPDRLVHFTSVDAAKAIIASQKLYMVKTRPPAGESRWDLDRAYRPLVEAILNDERLGDNARRKVEGVQALQLHRLYLTSFTTEASIDGDHHWLEYGDDNTGVALVFNVDSERLGCQLVTPGHRFLGRCRYDLAAFSALVVEHLNRVEPQYVSDVLHTAASFMKPEESKPDEEWRAGITAQTGGTSDSVPIRVGVSLRVPGGGSVSHQLSHGEIERITLAGLEAIGRTGREGVPILLGPNQDGLDLARIELGRSCQATVSDFSDAGVEVTKR